MPLSSQNRFTTLEVKVRSKGQLPKELRKRLGIQNGSRIRFNIPAKGPILLDRVSYELEDLWKIADEGGKPGRVMSFEEMGKAKTKRKW